MHANSLIYKQNQWVSGKMKQHERGNMTHDTDANRAEFEAAYVSEKLRIIGSDGSSDGEKAIRTIHLRRNANGDYDNSLEAHFAWWAWQAARRAPAAPVPQGWKRVPVIPTDEMVDAACQDGINLNGRPVWKHTYDVQATWRWQRMIAAAPQPPEAQASVSNGTLAAPVELPEYGIDTANHAGIRVRGYTEQQVRELLAAHGIKVSQ
jgi:hypothetical protein